MIAIGPDRFRSKAAASPELGAGSGGNVDDISRRLSAVEVGVATVREQVAEMRGEMRHLATKADMKDMENRLIKWILGALLAGTSVAVGIAQVLARLLGHP